MPKEVWDGHLRRNSNETGLNPEIDLNMFEELVPASSPSTASSCFTDAACFTNRRFATTLRGASIGTIFPTEFAHFVCLCPILVILAIFQIFSIVVTFVVVTYDW